jgi:hypothetical protein
MSRGLAITSILTLGASLLLSATSCRSKPAPKRMPYVETTPARHPDPEVQAAVDREITRRQAQVQNALDHSARGDALIQGSQ